MLAYQKDGTVKLLEKGYEIQESLTRGFYALEHRSMGLFSTPVVVWDDPPVLPNSAMQIAREYMPFGYIEEYFSEKSREIHRDLGANNKLGYIFQGKQGTGKSTICEAACKYFVDRLDARAFRLRAPSIGDLEYVIGFIKEVKKKTETEFFTVIMVDECEDLMDERENRMKSILDSDDSLDNNLFFFTTNYPDQIPETIQDRPSRIKENISVEGIDETATIHEIISSMNESLKDNVKLEDQVVRDIVPDLKGRTVDEIKNTFLDRVFNYNITQANLKALKEEVEEESQ